MSNQRFVVTISHQLGCGGAYIGQKIAEEFQIPFVDRDILKRVADELHLAEADLENRDERLSSVWEKLTEQRCIRRRRRAGCPSTTRAIRSFSIWSRSIS